MDEQPAQPKPRLTFGQRSDVGMVRGNNQDSAFSIVFADDSSNIASDFGIFIMADGMGGHHDGERASRLMTRFVSRQVMNLLHENELTDDATLLDKLADVIRQGQIEVEKTIRDGDSTCTIAVIFNAKVCVAHTGDCRVYVMTDNHITLITEDYPPDVRLMEFDVIEADAVPKNFELITGIRWGDPPPIKKYTHALTPNNYLLLCSDGLWRHSKSQELLEIVQNAKTLQSACDSLIRLAYARGATDNVTVIVVQIP